jgi:hypothetical protein
MLLPYLIPMDIDTVLTRRTMLYMQPPSKNNQAWYEANKWHTLYNQLTEERVRDEIRNGCPTSKQDKVDQKNDDYCMVSNETFLDCLYCLLVTDNRQKRAEKP